LWAQDVTEPSLKAALVYNFARFTEWPADALPANAPLVACVLGSDAISEALDRTAKGRLLAGHRISVTKTTVNGTLRSCHLLYVSEVGAAQSSRLAGALRDLPVLTIVDTETAATVDGVVRVSLENGRMRFDLDHGLAKRDRLQLSSKLLSLASHIKDEPAGGTR
jgi:hypothetical protein